MATASETERTIELSRLPEGGGFEATNVRGGTMRVGEGEGSDFTPVELLLVAIAGCSAIDVEYVAGKQASPARLDVHARGDKVRDDDGHHMTGLQLTFDVAFPDGPEGDPGRERLDRAIAMSRDRLCTVSRTVTLGSPVEMERADRGLSPE